MKSKYILYILSLICIAVVYGSCVNDPEFPYDTVNATKPEVKTVKVTEKTATSITLSAEVLTENGAQVTEYGAYWSKETPIDTVNAERVKADGKGKGSFTVKINNLKGSSLYYIAPYALNKKGIGLGEELEVNTSSGLGIIRTLSPQDTTATSAIVGGVIDIHGEGEILERGVYLSYTPNLLTPDSIIPSSMQTDSFVCDLKKLKTNTKYFVKAYVKNNFGIMLGSEKSFTTTSGKPTLGNFTKIAVDFYDATFSAEVISEGDAKVTASGFCWKIEDSPTIEDDTIVCSSGPGVFVGKIENLTPKTRYLLRAYAINDYGVSYSTDSVVITKNIEPYVVLSSNENPANGSVKVMGEIIDEGETAVIEYGFCWATTHSLPDIQDTKMAIGSGKESFEGIIESLKGGKTYYIRAYAKNEFEVSYSEKVISFTTPPIYVEKKGFGNIRIQGTTGFFQDDNYAYLLGGDSGADYTNELWRYSPASNSWDQMRPYSEDKVYGQTAVYSQQNTFVFGGKKVGNAIGSFYAYSSSTNEWSLKVPSSTIPPDPTALTAGCALDNGIFYFGGLRNDSICSDVWRYTTITNEWSKKNNFPTKQYGGIAVTYDHIIYAGLGINNMTTKANNKTLWRYVEINDSWVTETNIPTDASLIIGGVIANDNLFVIDKTAQIWQYSFEKSQWTKKSRLTVLNDNVHCIYSIKNNIYIGFGLETDKFILYDPIWDN